jgi:hypothetical protein
MQSYPNRCQHLKINGTQCGSPALRRNRFCFFHKRFQDEQIKLSADRARRGVATFVLPVLEDANSIQIALMQVMRLLVCQQIEHKTASLLLYALQTASTNLRLTNFKPFIHEVVLDPRTVNDTPLDSNLWEDEDFEGEEEEETEADRKIAALETVRKKKEEDAKWMKWAEAQYPNPTPKPSPQPTPQSHPQQTPPQKQMKPDHSSASVTPASAAEVAPASAPPKKPASGPNPTEVRRQISEQIRKAFPQGYASIGGSKSAG